MSSELFVLKSPHCRFVSVLSFRLGTFTPLFKMKFVVILPIALAVGAELTHGFHLPAHVAKRLSDELQGAVQHATNKRQISDPLTTPIQGQ